MPVGKIAVDRSSTPRGQFWLADPVATYTSRSTYNKYMMRSLWILHTCATHWDPEAAFAAARAAASCRTTLVTTERMQLLPPGNKHPPVDSASSPSLEGLAVVVPPQQERRWRLCAIFHMTLTSTTRTKGGLIPFAELHPFIRAPRSMLRTPPGRG